MNKLSKVTLREALTEIYSRISELESLESDNRDLMLKLLKQNNKIVDFLKLLEVEEIVELESSNPLELPDALDLQEPKGFTHIKEILEEYLDRYDDLKEFEEELKKVKANITPGQVGEA